MNEELNNVVEDAVNDAVSDTGPVVDDASTVPDVSTDTGSVDTQVADPATSPDTQAQTQAVVDEFSQKYGIPSQSVTGRENRIPYSRVKKIVEKAQNDAKEALKKELEGQFSPKLTDYETKVKSYEDRLTKVAQFEQILENDPQTFLTMLSNIPAYRPFFEQLAQLAAGSQQGSVTPQRDPTTGRFVGQAQQGQSADPMPQPDQQMPDGSMVYSMDGLKSLLDWNARNVENRVTQQVQQRYAPIEQQFQRFQQQQALIPQIERQIADARTWDRFNELEPEVIKILQSDNRISLERAYMQAYQQNVVPKLAADRNKVRNEVLEELKKAPAATSAPAARGYKAQPAQTGPRDLSDVIKEQIKGL